MGLRWLLALAVAGALALAGCAGDEPAADAGSPAGATTSGGGFPERVGERVVLATGEAGRWEVSLQESVAGLCILVREPSGDRREGCGFEVPERHDVAALVYQGESYQVVAGPVVSAASEVRIELEGGEHVEAEVRDDPTGSSDGASVYVAEVPPGRVVAVEALEGESVLARRLLDPVEIAREQGGG